VRRWSLFFALLFVGGVHPSRMANPKSSALDPSQRSSTQLRTDRDVRFAPINRHRQLGAACPKSANKRHRSRMAAQSAGMPGVSPDYPDRSLFALASRVCHGSAMQSLPRRGSTFCTGCCSRRSALRSTFKNKKRRILPCDFLFLPLQPRS
jgi:hypothetical protein